MDRPFTSHEVRRGGGGGPSDGVQEIPSNRAIAEMLTPSTRCRGRRRALDLRTLLFAAALTLRGEPLLYRRLVGFHFQ
jgi:hypothetical protein